jgi:hypothetical protein
VFTGIVYLSADGYLYVPVSRKLTGGAFMMLGQLGIVVPTGLPEYGRLIIATPQELKQISTLVNERGKSVNFTMTGLVDEGPSRDYSKVFYLEFKGSDLDKIRTSYGLAVQYPNRYKVAYAARPLSVFSNNNVSKIRDLNA